MSKFHVADDEIEEVSATDGARLASLRLSDPSLTVNLEPVAIRAFRGQEVSGQVPDIHETSALGEAIAITHLRRRLANVKKVNGSGHAAIDAVADTYGVEIKSGAVTNTQGAWQWRLTIGEPGQAEAVFLAAASDEDKQAYNRTKAAAIRARKDALLAELSGRLGTELRPRTVTVIIDHAQRLADVFEFDGFHYRIGWTSDQASRGYTGTYRFTVPELTARERLLARVRERGAIHLGPRIAKEGDERWPEREGRQPADVAGAVKGSVKRDALTAILEFVEDRKARADTIADFLANRKAVAKSLRDARAKSRRGESMYSPEGGADTRLYYAKVHTRAVLKAAHKRLGLSKQLAAPVESQLSLHGDRSKYPEGKYPSEVGEEIHLGPRIDKEGLERWPESTGAREGRIGQRLTPITTSIASETFYDSSTGDDPTTRVERYASLLPSDLIAEAAVTRLELYDDPDAFAERVGEFLGEDMTDVNGVPVSRYEGAMGMFDSRTRTIITMVEDDPFEDEPVSRIFYHEFGHAFDRRIESDDWSDPFVYEWSGTSLAGDDQRAEGFANAFSEFMVAKETGRLEAFAERFPRTATIFTRWGW